MQKEKFLGVDVGKKNVGIAISDDTALLAFPLMVCSRKTVVKDIFTIIENRKVTAVVLGESKNFAMQDNAIMKDVMEIKNALIKAGVVVHLTSEIYSTIEAGRLGRGRDDEAAAILLQGFLDKRTL